MASRSLQKFLLFLAIAGTTTLLSGTKLVAAVTQDTVDTARYSDKVYGTFDLPGKVTKWSFNGTYLEPGVTKTVSVALVIYPKFELLDVMGPLQFLSYEYFFNFTIIARKRGPVYSTQGIPTIATRSFKKAAKESYDMLFVPGGIGTFDIIDKNTTKVLDRRLVTFVRDQARKAKIVFTVCSGSGILARTGLLDGRKATSNKSFFDSMVKFGPKVNWVKKSRWVQDGKFITSSGVSAGMDAAIYLGRKTYGDGHLFHAIHYGEYSPNYDSNNDPFADQSQFMR